MPQIKISQLPYVGKSGYTVTDIIPFVSYIVPTGTTSETKIDDLKDYVLENSFFLPLSGGTVTGNTIFTSGLTATTISATTYQNLPIDPDTYTTGFTYNTNVFTIKQNNGQPDLTATINSVTGMTVNGNLTVTGNTSAQGFTATTISATTYQNLPIDPDTYTTGYTYNDNTFTIKQNNGQPDLTATINSVTGMTVNGNLTVTGNTSLQGLTATTISATTYDNLPIDPNTFVTGFTYGSNVFTIKQNNGQPDLTATINTVTGMTVNGDLTVTGNTLMDDLSATTISATTYYGSGTNLTGVVKGSGTTNYLPKWTGTTGLGDSIISDDGTNLGIGVPPQTPFKVWLFTSSNFKALRVTNAILTGSCIGIQVDAEGGGGASTGLVANSKTSFTGTSVGVKGLGGDGLLSIGVYGEVGPNDSGFVGTGIGGYFNGIGDGSYGYPTNSYGLQVIDGTEGINKVLVSQTADGKTNWSSNLTGLTSVSATTVSASTVTVGNTSGTPNQAASFDSTGKLVAGLGQTTFTAFGTAALGISSTTTTFTLVPGLTQTLTVPTNCSVYVVTTGGIGNTNGSSYSFTADFAVFVDGVVLTNGGYGRVNTYNPGTANAAFTNTTWAISTILNLAAGSHTIDVRVVYRNTTNAAQGANVSSSTGSVRQGELYIMILKN